MTANRALAGLIVLGMGAAACLWTAAAAHAVGVGDWSRFGFALAMAIGMFIGVRLAIKMGREDEPEKPPFKDWD